MKYLLINFLLSISLFLSAQNTEIQYLSGKGADDTRKWEFFCSAGMNSGQWTTIDVPSCWEQQGFGSYNYGHDKFEMRLNETGNYRYRFAVPSDWKNRRIEIVFDGVMTDAEVKINGKLADPVHQGAFYRFRYDITELLNLGKENLLEVFVKKHSDNISVSRAEREADFWIFGGIFRPVYLEAKPVESISRVAIDARANGELVAELFLSNIKNTEQVVVQIDGLPEKFTFEPRAESKVCRVEGKFGNIKTWNPEDPNLYLARFILLDKNGKTIHQITERIGFRTVEVRESDGIYLNGVRIKMQGVCRHTFHPRYGRTSSKTLSIEAVNLMKEMNMNAVRMSHYPPEKHFLEVCDSLGLLVLDELTAWQKPSYDDGVGRKLLEEMIARDVNHPSVILWDNGNEGGENNNLNDDFAELDIQKRKVLHPWQDYDLTNTLHYVDYNYLAQDGYSKRKIFFPTEFLHGLYDGGLGAGLEDYWLRMWENPLCAGGFLWVFADESIERTDRNRQLDSDGNHAPDGILGPHMEKEGSFYTIKEIWAPIQFEKKYITPQFDGRFRIENRYFFTDLEQCTLTANWVSYPEPETNVRHIIGSTEKLKLSLKPGEKGFLQLHLPEKWQLYDALLIEATDRFGRSVNRWCWPVKYPEIKAGELTRRNNAVEPSMKETDDKIEVSVSNLNITFSKVNGTLQTVTRDGNLIPLSAGPVFVSGERKVSSVKGYPDAKMAVVNVQFDNGDWFQWKVDGDGFVYLEVVYEPGGYMVPWAGVTFSFPEKNITGMRWLGNGPYRVYKNRMKGVQFGLWEKVYNNTITGESGFEYPEFKGYHSEVYWAKVKGTDGLGFNVAIESKDLFLRMLTPADPVAPAKTKIEYPKGDISFLHSINAIGTKFTDPVSSGPQSVSSAFMALRIHGEKLKMKLTFDFH